MSIIYNGTTISTLKYNNTDISKVIYNGITVFSKTTTKTVSYSNSITLDEDTRSSTRTINISSLPSDATFNYASIRLSGRTYTRYNSYYCYYTYYSGSSSKTEYICNISAYTGSISESGYASYMPTKVVFHAQTSDASNLNLTCSVTVSYRISI